MISPLSLGLFMLDRDGFWGLRWIIKSFYVELDQYLEIQKWVNLNEVLDVHSD